MRSGDLVRHKDRLDALFLQVKGLQSDPDMISHWSRYLCVLVSGFIEVAIQLILTRFAEKQSSPPVAYFVSRRMRDLMNPKMGKILDVIADFDQGIRDEIAKLTEGELRDAVDGVVQNRNKIAHGIEIGIGFTTIQNYYHSVIKVIELIESRFPAK
jgi:hypothetical protein